MQKPKGFFTSVRSKSTERVTKRARQRQFCSVAEITATQTINKDKVTEYCILKSGKIWVRREVYGLACWQSKAVSKLKHWIEEENIVIKTI